MVKRTLLSKKGASSVFVMLLLVVLMVFGVAALTLALSNARLGQKVTDRNSAYYALEGIAWERFAQTDKALEHAYAQSGGFEDGIINHLSAALPETDIYTDGDTVMIAYTITDTDSDVGLSVTLAFDTGNRHSLRPVSWKQMQ